MYTFLTPIFSIVCKYEYSLKIGQTLSEIEDLYYERTKSAKVATPGD